MESILRYLQDPGWWFTAVFIALIVAVGGGFIRERLVYPMLAALSTRFKKRNATRALARENATAALAANPEYLILTFLCATCVLVVVAIGFVLLTFLALFPQVAPSMQTEEAVKVRDGIHSVTLIFSLFLLAGIGARVLSRLSLAMAAYKRYRTERGLPPLLG